MVSISHVFHGNIEELVERSRTSISSFYISTTEGERSIESVRPYLKEHRTLYVDTANRGLNGDLVW
jgi:hypothetical protein